MIKNIIFDMGNVLVMFYPQKTLRKYLSDERDVQALYNAFYKSGAYRECDRGVKTYAQVIDEISPGLDERLVRLIKKLYLEQCFGKEEMPVFEEMYEIVLELKKNGYKTYLLSNAGFDFYEYSQYIPAISLMDGKVVSCDYKIIKPEEGIYTALLEKYSLKPEECLFIDDMQENILGAQRCGIDGICFSPSFGAVASLRERLREKGIKI